MCLEKVMTLVETLLEKELDEVDFVILTGSWVGKTYKEMALGSSYTHHYLQRTGADLWKTLSEITGERITKYNFGQVLVQYVPSSLGDCYVLPNNPPQKLHDHPTRLVYQVKASYDTRGIRRSPFSGKHPAKPLG
ncbi:MAG: hypothetical protein ACKO1W_09365 [Microcystaceae cyanobacterium]